MSIRCLMNGLEVNYPCSPACALFGDCCAAFDAQRKERVVTNADHVRSMTDEELAHEIMCPYHTEPDMCNSVKTCNECCLDWLKQPYKEER